MTITPTRNIRGYLATQSYPLTSYTIYAPTRTEALSLIIKAITKN